MKSRFPVYPFIIFFTVFLFFTPFFLHDKLPIPSDTIVGLYHPFRDLYAADYPNGIPYKNALITDPVRQQYPWRFLAIEQLKKGELPLWNPYNLSGSPLAANVQTGAFYPFNILFFITPFYLGWSILIMLQPLLAGLFLYWYLRSFKLHPLASVLGGITFAFSGFSVAWMEWGTIGHVALWIPLILLSIDKLEVRIKNQELRNRQVFLWSFIFLFSLTSSFLAGHLQTFFYVALVSIAYFFIRWWQYGRSKKLFLLFLFFTSCFLLLTAIQWWPALQLINQSARSSDLISWQEQEGWFIPVIHLIQFVVPDFFGNPTTLNYWGTWNYGELVGYVGIVPLLFALFAFFFRKDKKTYFFGFIAVFSLLFALPTVLAKLPYQLSIPFLSTSQPTRLLFLTDFSVSILAAFGFDWFLRLEEKKQKNLIPIGILSIFFIWLWFFVLQGKGEDFLVAKHNLYLPTAIFVGSLFIFVAMIFWRKQNVQRLLFLLLVLITIFDLLRFAQKFTPFTDKDYLFPKTAITSFLQKDTSLFRIMENDPRIMTPNLSARYHIQSVDGYDPLYLERYGELIAANERRGPDIHTPFGFNRTVTPESTESATITNLLGVKYVLSFTNLAEPRFTKVFEEGKTLVYKNNDAYPRVFFVQKIKPVTQKQDAVTALFDKTIDVRKVAVVEGFTEKREKVYEIGKVTVRAYEPERIMLETENKGTGFLILTDTFYPTWHAFIDGKETTIYRTDYNFRGVVIPSGNHTILFENSLL